MPPRTRAASIPGGMRHDAGHWAGGRRVIICDASGGRQKVAQDTGQCVRSYKLQANVFFFLLMSSSHFQGKIVILGPVY